MISFFAFEVPEGVPLARVSMNQPTTPTSVPINRFSIGVIAIVLLMGAAILWFAAGSQNMWTGACLKVGLVMAALWLALPNGARQGNWGHASLGTVVGFLLLGLVLIGKRVDFRIVLPMLFGVAIAIKVLRPTSKNRSR